MEYKTDHTLEITGASAAKIFAMLQQDGDKTRAFTVSGDEESSELIVIAATGEAAQFPIGDDLEVIVNPDYAAFEYGEELLEEGYQFGTWSYFEFEETLILDEQ
jgi:hypothetical protein